MRCEEVRYDKESERQSAKNAIEKADGESGEDVWNAEGGGLWIMICCSVIFPIQR